MKIIKISETESFYNQPGITGKNFYESPKLDVVHLELEPGRSLEPHPMPMTVLFYVLEGTGVLTVDGKKYKLSQDRGLECPKGLLRFWSNESKEKLRVLVLKINE